MFIKWMTELIPERGWCLVFFPFISNKKYTAKIFVPELCLETEKKYDFFIKYVISQNWLKLFHSYFDEM